MWNENFLPTEPVRPYSKNMIVEFEVYCEFDCGNRKIHLIPIDCFDRKRYLSKINKDINRMSLFTDPYELKGSQIEDICKIINEMDRATDWSFDLDEYDYLKVVVNMDLEDEEFNKLIDKYNRDMEEYEKQINLYEEKIESKNKELINEEIEKLKNMLNNVPKDHVLMF